MRAAIRLANEQRSEDVTDARYTLWVRTAIAFVGVSNVIYAS
jgi:hypothetical protein